ncbi:hypothetical protein BWP39_28635 [Paraburkholderia acidicola]|uniref:HPP transmembrane region domain-containing protein n=1 Tax=Paraburkholderia acidicola TaxID=1912599 RepID=A0A2A4ER94_9BURK|nr:HPP family protein [Paraburkholderia acidicola]PCE23651.1 hypothetical protein BWP39_28635 [Paraburkholderia acidicola]
MTNPSDATGRIARSVSRLPVFRAACGFLGGVLAITVIGLFGGVVGMPLLIAPFGASSVLLFAAPDSAFAQPRNLVWGHLIASTVGLVVFWLAGAGLWQMALAVGAAIALMQLTRTVHPPAGADPLVIMLGGGASGTFLLFPVLAGVLLLLLIALVFNWAVHGEPWPRRDIS